MRACSPSSPKPGPSTYLSDVEQSGWLSSLTTLLQLASAVADLINVQGSSVLIALEKGMDATAQVRQLLGVSIVSGFRTVVRKLYSGVSCANDAHVFEL